MAQNDFTDFEIQQSFDEVQAWGGEQRPLVAPGDYRLTVIHVEQKPSSNNQPMVAVTFEVADDGEQKGAKVYNNYSLQPQALGRLKALMVACGASLSGFRASEIMGATIRASVIHTEGQAKVDQQGNPLPARTFANVINELPLDDGPVQAATQTPPVLKGKPANGAVRRA